MAFFYYVNYLIYRAREFELTRYNLSLEQAQILAMINNAPKKATPASLARLLFRKPNSVTVLLDRMEKKGLVTKIPVKQSQSKDVDDSEKYNKVEVMLTDDGKQAYKQTAKRVPINRIIGVLSPTEMRQFHDILDNMINKAAEEMGYNRDPLPPSE